MKIRRPLIALVAVILAAAGAQVLAQPAKKPAKFLYCPQCGFEMTWYQDQAPEMNCPRCNPKKKLEIFTYSHRPEPEPDFAPPRDMRALYVAAGFPVVLLAVWGFMSWRKKDAKVTENCLVTRCPACGRKIKYPVSFAGQRSSCPRCKGRFIFPARA
jgi:hypothetical protein